jgi:hypothetical protein
MIKKLISGITAIALASMMFTATVSADDTSVFSFDNATGLTFWSTEGEDAIKATGFELSISNSVAHSGAGSLAVSEDMTTEAPKIAGGAYFSSSSVGVDTLAGCTVSAMIYPDAKALDLGAVITMYSDGEVYIPVSSAELKPNTWNEIVIKVPANCNNTKIGFNIPLNRIYKGVVFYLDDLKITYGNGIAVASVGDAEEAQVELFDTLSPLQRYLMIAGFVVLVGGVIIFIVTYVVKSRKKYR